MDTGTDFSKMFGRQFTGDNIVPFQIGCRHCVHLVQTGKCNYYCAKVQNGSRRIHPIWNGKKTKYWGACDGNFREKGEVCRESKKKV